jgi:hypothetical protein
MWVGISIYGLMYLSPDARGPEFLEDHPLCPLINLVCNELAPIVTSYTYLGLDVIPDLDPTTLLAPKVLKMQDNCTNALPLPLMPGTTNGHASVCNQGGGASTTPVWS